MIGCFVKELLPKQNPRSVCAVRSDTGTMLAFFTFKATRERPTMSVASEEFAAALSPIERAKKLKLTQRVKKLKMCANQR